MKKIILLIVLFTSFELSTYGQSLSQKEIKNKKLIYILNNITKVEEGTFSPGSENGFLVRIYNVSNPSGSAGGESDEVTTSLYITTSGFGEHPEQHLFKLSSVYNPKFGQFTKTENGLEVTFIYGDKQTSTILINLKRLTFKN